MTPVDLHLEVHILLAITTWADLTYKHMPKAGFHNADGQNVRWQAGSSALPALAAKRRRGVDAVVLRIRTARAKQHQLGPGPPSGIVPI